MAFRTWSRTTVGLTACLVCVLAVFSLFSQAGLQVGYAVLTRNAQGTIPVATALFSFWNLSGVLVAEAGVAAVEPISVGRIIVDENGPRTGVAFANASGEAVDLTLILRDDSGDLRDEEPLRLEAATHVAKFADELFTLPEGFLGSLTFQTAANRKVAAVTLRQSVNAHNEALLATLPVASLESPPGSEDTIVFPHLGAGGILSTQLALMNPGASLIRGTIRLIGSDGNPLQLSLDGLSGSEFSFEVQPNGVFRGLLTLDSGGAKAGYAVVSVTEGPAPVGTAIFQYRDAADNIVSEAGVASHPPTTKARVFVDNARTQTGVALASFGNGATQVTFDLLDRNGFFMERTVRSLPAGGHTAIFADQLFEELPDGFTGLMEITSPVPIVPVTLKLSQNARSELILTTLPVADLNRPLSAASLVFPQVGLGFIPGFGTFATRLIVIDMDGGQAVAGGLIFTQSGGAPMVVPMSGQTASEFDYEVPGGGARQFYPGVTAELATIFMPEPNAVVNEGATYPLRPILLDSAGNSRDDFQLEFTTLDSTKVTVDELGRLFGQSRGFATVTVSSGGIVVSVSVAVATISSGTQGLEVTGIAQDFSDQLYLASGPRHTILQSASLSAAPQLYAGQDNSAGLVNNSRLASKFNVPSFLALDQAQGRLLVSDSSNHVIRLVEPGNNGLVSTLAGSGSAGSQDGSLAAASFRNPKGIALDRDGRIWVVDSGNHTVRRIDPVAGLVDTVAGQAGSAGNADGVGTQARFQSPQGITFETEPLNQQLERELAGEPPPPISMIVADTGNNLLRRVWEDGTVETLSQATLSGLRRNKGEKTPTRLLTAPFKFAEPTGVIVDSFGGIYVSETQKGRVRILLQNGKIWQAVQPGTFSNPNGMALTRRGRVVVAERNRSAQEIRYAGPSISEIRPLQIPSLGGAQVEILGDNFATETLVIVGGVPILDAEVITNRRIAFIAPPLPSGRLVVTLQHRGGLAQAFLLVQAIPVGDLSAGDVTTVVGGATFAGDGLFATQANLVSPSGIAFDTAGNLFIADRASHRVRKVNSITQLITTVAGTGEPGWAGDGGAAVAAQLNAPEGVAVHEDGSLYIADAGNHVIRRVSPTGTITHYAGTGTPGFSGDGGPALEASFATPRGVAVSPSGDLFVADMGNHRIRRIASSNGVVSTIVGNGESGWNGDGGPARLATLTFPHGLGFDLKGNLFIADTGNHLVRRVDAEKLIIQTVAGSGEPGFWGDGRPAVEAGLNLPTGIALDPSGNLFIGDTFNSRVRRVDGSSGFITTWAGNGVPAFGGDGGSALEASLNLPTWLVLNAGEDVLISDGGNLRVRRVLKSDRRIETVAGKGEVPEAGDGVPAYEAVLAGPAGLDFDGMGSLVFADPGDHRVRQVASPSGNLLNGGIIGTIAGTGTPGFSEDGELAILADLNRPSDTVVEPGGTLLEMDTGTHRLRRIFPQATGAFSFLGLAGTAEPGTIVTVAGNGEPGFSGDGGPARQASISSPRGSAVDPFGNICLADTENHRVRCIGPTGEIFTIAGNGEAGFTGDGIPARQSSLNHPAAVTFDSAGNLYIADTGNHRVRVVFDGVIETVAGIGKAEFSGDGGAANEAALRFPIDIVFDDSGNLFIADSGNHRVRRVSERSGVISTVAGTGERGFGGDGGPAIQAHFSGIRALAFDNLGNLFISDSLNRRVRAVKGPIP